MSGPLYLRFNACCFEVALRDKVLVQSLLGSHFRLLFMGSTPTQNREEFGRNFGLESKQRLEDTSSLYWLGDVHLSLRTCGREAAADC